MPHKKPQPIREQVNPPRRPNPKPPPPPPRQPHEKPKK